MNLKKLLSWVIIFSILVGNISTSFAYVLPVTTVDSYMTALNSNITQYDTHVTDLTWVINNLWTIATNNNTSTLDSSFMSIYNSIISTKTSKTTDLNNKLTQITTVKNTLNTKFLNNEIWKEDYWILSNKLDWFASSVKLELINLWSVDSYLSSKTSLINAMNTKLTALATNKTEMTTKKTSFSTVLTSYKNKITTFSTTRETTDLDLVNSLSTQLDWLVTDNQIYNLLINTNIQELNALLKEYTALKDSLIQYQQKLAYLGTLTFDVTVELWKITTSMNEKVAQTALSTQLTTQLNTNSTTTWVTKTWIDKVLTNILIDWLISNTSNISNDATVTWLNLYRIWYKLPLDWYVYISDDTTTQNSNQAILKGVYTQIWSNTIDWYWIELPSVSWDWKTNEFIQNLPIKKVQEYWQSIGLNVNKKQVFKIEVKYNSDLWSKTYNVTKDIDLSKYNLYKTDWSPLVWTWMKTLTWIELEPWQYSINIRLWLDKGQVDSSLSDLLSDSTTLRKRLYLTIVDKNQKTVYNEPISLNTESVIEFTSISIKNLWEIAFNTTVETNISIDYANFITWDVYTSYITDLSLSFLGYASTAYKTLQDSIITWYKSKLDNKITDSSGKIIAYKRTSVNIDVNKDQSTRTVTYKKLNDVKWNTVTKQFELVTNTYILEQNVIIDPTIKAYLKKWAQTPWFDLRFNDIRNWLINSWKVEKYTRLVDAQWKDLVTEYRYFDSTSNNNTSLSDTTWKVLVFFRIVEVIKEWDRAKWIDRIENVYYKVWLDENYWKVVNTNNTAKTISTAWDIADADKPSILAINPIMKYKVFTYYTLYFDKTAYLAWDLKSSIRYTKIYEKSMLDYWTIKYNGSTIGDKWSGVIFLDTVKN